MEVKFRFFLYIDISRLLAGIFGKPVAKDVIRRHSFHMEEDKRGIHDRQEEHVSTQLARLVNDIIDRWPVECGDTGKTGPADG